LCGAYEVLVISSLAAWAGNETPRKWQGPALKLLSQLDLGVAKVVRPRRTGAQAIH
jgi:hypothetical protein